MTEGVITKRIAAPDVRGRAFAEGDGVKRDLILNILLFGINGFGIVGALLEALGAEWRSGLNQALFWGGLLVICAVSVLWWQGKKKSRVIWRTAALCLGYAVGLFWFWEAVIRELWESLQSGPEGYEEMSLQYLGELIQLAAESSENAAAFRSLGFLAVLLPFGLLTGFFCARGKWQIFLAENILWIFVACYTNIFPGIPFLAVCVAGIVLETAKEEFGDNGKVWARAGAGILALALLGVWFSTNLAMPALNRLYAGSTELRHDFYVTVNHEWIPALQELVNDHGIGRGVDVTGTLGRQRYFNRTSAGIYQVTLDERPRRTLYLRGFVGARYSRRQWEAEEESALEQYYRDKGLVLSSNSADLLNIGYRAMEERGRQGRVRIEELAGRGSYSLLPYGALVTDGYSANSSGSVERQGESYEFVYREFSGVGRDMEFAGRWEFLEKQYRQYVYDSFLEYPAERLPRLTEALEEADLPREDVYQCAEAIISFLEEHAGYRLDAAATPLGKDFVEYFLFDSHEGYCAHFASAAVLMFRYCGIPARYATGYSASAQRFSEAEENLYTAVLTGAQAHAWAEVYVDGVGWVPVEATPGAAAFAEDNRLELLARLGELTGDIDPLQDEGAAEGGDREEEEEEDSEPDFITYEDEEDWEDEEEEEDENGDAGFGDVMRCLLLLLALSAAAAVTGSFARKRYWNKKRKESDGKEKIFLLYRNMRNALSVMGCSRKLLLTGETFWLRLHRALPTQEEKDYETICAILEQSSFGNRAPTREELAAMERLHDDMLKRLYFKASRLKKLAFKGLICCVPE